MLSLDRSPVTGVVNWSVTAPLVKVGPVAAAGPAVVTSPTREATATITTVEAASALRPESRTSLSTDPPRDSGSTAGGFRFDCWYFGWQRPRAGFRPGRGAHPEGWSPPAPAGCSWSGPR